MRYAVAWLLSIFAWTQASSPAAAVDYERDVKPILRQHCYSCHGSLRQKSGLRLDHVTFLRQGGDRGAAIETAGSESLLVRAVRGTLDEVERMPLDAKPLSDDEIAKLSSWIDEGAKAPDEPLPDDPRKHWSFQVPVRPPLPAVTNPAWSTHPIDRFLAAEHQARGLTPTEPAPKHVLLRRVYLDLIGLPPSPAELAEVAADSSADAYEKVVDRLLASPQYGERWGRHWMDVWRYSDWDGYAAEVRESQPHIWRWRDWIIESLNTDKPYNDMIVEMLAADEIAPEDPKALRATGFLVRNWYKFNRNVWLEGTVEHTSKAFLGITVACARCHDHMYDPILQTEYYQFRALFEPYDVRTDRMPGEADLKKDGLARVYDADASKPTYLFMRGNEARPDKEHPLPPGVPRALGGEVMTFTAVNLPATSYYPGLRGFVQNESLAQATAGLNSAEQEMAKANTVMVAARKKLSDFVAAKTAAVAKKDPPTDATQDAAKNSADQPASNESEAEVITAATQAQTAVSFAEERLLAANALLVAVRAKIAADNGAFATPPAANAKELAFEASREERVFNALDAKYKVMRAEQEVAAHKPGDDDASKKKAEAAAKQLAEAHNARETAQAALAQTSESYTRFAQVYSPTSTGRRAALARWIASTSNPLTARVAINHIWMRHFGSPLVQSVFDFGLNGKRPTHPALLDWLAVELVDHGWRMKHIHRLLVTSSAYRMKSSSGNEANLARDPENLFLWRMNPRRMEAEVVRDSTLCVADGLDPTMFGADLDQASGLTVARRSIYFRSSKEKKVAFLEMFDSPNVTDCYRRSETIVPQQALAMVNSSLTLAQARRLAGILAARLETKSTPEGLAAFVAAAFERILCRPPSRDELATCLEFLQIQSRSFADPKALTPFASGAENAVKPSSDPDQRARENLVHVLLNHNDFLTVR
jgi:mono/diheme cytochrome c family protein